MLATFRKGIAAELATLTEQVVAPTELRIETIRLECSTDYLELPRLIVQSKRGHKAEVDIADVVIDSPATRGAAHHIAAVAKQLLYIAFRKGILVLSHHDGASVLPKVQHHRTRIGLGDKIVFNSHIPIGIGLVTEKEMKHKSIVLMLYKQPYGAFLIV